MRPLPVRAVVVVLAVLALAACDGPIEPVVPLGYTPVGDGRLVVLQVPMGTLDGVRQAEVVAQDPAVVTIRVLVQRGSQPSRLQLVREATVVLAAPLAGRRVRDAAGATLPPVARPAARRSSPAAAPG